MTAATPPDVWSDWFSMLFHKLWIFRSACPPRLWWRISNREEAWEEVDISLKTLKLPLCFCLYKADLVLFKWASVAFGALERIAFAFHPPQTVIQPKQNVRSKQQNHTSVPSGCLTHSKHPFALKMPTPWCSSLYQGMGAELRCQTLANPMGNHGLTFQSVPCHPWVDVDDGSPTDPVNQKCWMFWPYTFYGLTILLNWVNHDEALRWLEFKN